MYAHTGAIVEDPDEVTAYWNSGGYLVVQFGRQVSVHVEDQATADRLVGLVREHFPEQVEAVVANA